MVLKITICLVITPIDKDTNLASMFRGVTYLILSISDCYTVFALA